MKIIEVIRASDLKKYYIANIKCLLKKRSVEFILVSSDKKMPDITMVITYIKLIPDSNLFMISTIDTKKLGFMVSAVVEQELEAVGKTITKSLCFSLSQKGKDNNEKESRVFKGYRSELGVTD